MSTALNDAIFADLIVHPGALNDKKLAGLKTNIVDALAPQSTIMDAVNSLGVQESFRGAISDTKLAYFLANGATAKDINDAALEFWLAGGLATPVELVLARYSALSAGEISAITAFVEGLEADGAWDNITEVYAPCLNATDFLIGMKHQTLQPSANPPVHTAGEFVEFSNNNMHYLDEVNFDTFATVEGFMGVYNVFTGADTTGNSDMFGVADVAGNECYLRWRGTDTTDFNDIYNVTGSTPRTAANARPTGDMVGMGLEGTDIFNLSPGGIITKATRTPTPVPAGFPCQWHGQNLQGTPAAGNMANSRYSLMLQANGLLSSVAQGTVRARCLQFLRDIGVTGVPVT